MRLFKQRIVEGFTPDTLLIQSNGPCSIADMLRRIAEEIDAERYGENVCAMFCGLITEEGPELMSAGIDNDSDMAAILEDYREELLRG